MNTVLPTNPPLPPHLFNRRLSPSRSQTPSAHVMSRKRKADDDPSPNDGDTRMSRSPSASPSISVSTLPPTTFSRGHNTKRTRTNIAARPLQLTRLLETLSPDDLRSMLKTVCDKHPQVRQDILSTAPRPNVDTVLGVLGQYESHLHSAFPFGGHKSSDYAFNRVRVQLVEFLDAIREYTPNFLPPYEAQAGVSLKFLDAVSNMVHRLPDWDSFQNNRHKTDTYEELGKAWAVVIREAAKRGGGIQLRIGDWEGRLAKHHAASGNRLGEAVHELRCGLNWNGEQQQGGNMGGESIRQQLLSGSYGAGDGVRVGPW